jgi:hypothetical protein
MYAVTVNEGPLSAEDNAVLFCNAEPTYKAIAVDFEDEPKATTFRVVVEFTPTNGPHKGRPMRVPYGRVVSISGP